MPISRIGEPGLTGDQIVEKINMESTMPITRTDALQIQAPTGNYIIHSMYVNTAGKFVVEYDDTPVYAWQVVAY